MTTATSIVIKLRTKTLRLRPDAPFPSQIASARELIKAWRDEQKEKESKPCGQR